jgi:hypothetical protein
MIVRLIHEKKDEKDIGRFKIEVIYGDNVWEYDANEIYIDGEKFDDLSYMNDKGIRKFEKIIEAEGFSYFKRWAGEYYNRKPEEIEETCANIYTRKWEEKEKKFSEVQKMFYGMIGE